MFIDKDVSTGKGQLLNLNDIFAGFGVGTIEIYNHVKVDNELNVGEEIAKLKLGSTVRVISLHLQQNLFDIKLKYHISL